MSEWRCIDTAPKDGRGVMAYIRSGWIEGVYWVYDRWHFLSDGSPTESHQQPTHWMPLPSPPDSIGERKAK